MKPYPGGFDTGYTGLVGDQALLVYLGPVKSWGSSQIGNFPKVDEQSCIDKKSRLMDEHGFLR